jgi:parallel beta-helix repeat protein
MMRFGEHGNGLGAGAKHPVGECVAEPGRAGFSQHGAVIADLRAGGCGEAIHLLSSSHSRMIGNVVTGNAGGVSLTDELGPAADNLIATIRSTTTGSIAGSRSRVTRRVAVSLSGVPKPARGGIYDNTISQVLDNTATGSSHAGTSIAATRQTRT